jgi:hypothetical protein
MTSNKVEVEVEVLLCALCPEPQISYLKSHISKSLKSQEFLSSLTECSAIVPKLLHNKKS